MVVGLLILRPDIGKLTSRCVEEFYMSEILENKIL